MSHKDVINLSMMLQKYYFFPFRRLKEAIHARKDKCWDWLKIMLKWPRTWIKKINCNFERVRIKNKVRNEEKSGNEGFSWGTIWKIIGICAFGGFRLLQIPVKLPFFHNIIKWTNLPKVSSLLYSLLWLIQTSSLLSILSLIPSLRPP